MLESLRRCLLFTLPSLLETMTKELSVQRKNLVKVEGDDTKECHKKGGHEKPLLRSLSLCYALMDLSQPCWDGTALACCPPTYPYQCFCHQHPHPSTADANATQDDSPGSPFSTLSLPFKRQLWRLPREIFRQKWGRDSQYFTRSHPNICALPSLNICCSCPWRD